MRWLRILLICGLIVCSLGSCKLVNQPVVKGSGNVITETREVANFQRVSIKGIGTLILQQGSQESLTIEGDDNILTLIDATVQAGTLEIGPSNVKLKPSKSLTYTLALKNLDELHILGAINTQSGLLKGEGLTVTINGASNLTLAGVELESATMTINGVGKIEIESGQLNEQAVTINGTGQYTAANVKTQKATVKINGTGKATVWSERTLDVGINGTGTVSYYGSPVVSQRVAGVGKVKSLGAK
jgi:hypothetical protein